MASCVSPLVAMELFLHEWVCFFVYHLQNHARVTPCAVLMVSQYFIDQQVVTRQVAPQCSRQKASREDWRIVHVDVMNAGFQNACKVRSAEAKKWTQHTLVWPQEDRLLYTRKHYRATSNSESDHVSDVNEYSFIFVSFSPIVVCLILMVIGQMRFPCYNWKRVWWAHGQWIRLACRCFRNS